MFVLVLACLGLAAAAPHYYGHHSHHGHHDRYMDMDTDMGFPSSFGRDLFDTNGFWAEMEAGFRELDEMMRLLHTKFPGASSTAGVVGNNYQVIIPLPGYVENEIIVKAREGVLMVQAIHKSDGNSVQNYLDVRTMPANVDVAGIWTYKDDVLTITFPLKTKTTIPSTDEPRREVEPVTEETKTFEGASTEEVEQTEGQSQDVTQDADVGVTKDIQTNEISKVPVEATTYAVDLKNQYEFVPVHY